jgi:hypothetical protein
MGWNTRDEKLLGMNYGKCICLLTTTYKPTHSPNIVIPTKEEPLQHIQEIFSQIV